MLLDFGAIPSWAVIAIFVVSAGVIGVAGVRLTRTAETIAEGTGMGAVITGGLFLGASTSLPGLGASVFGAATGHPSLAISNAAGGISAQTAFLAIGDVMDRSRNLEYGARTVGSLIQGAVLVCFLGAVIIAVVGPAVAIVGVHPVSPLLFVAYAFGLRVVSTSEEEGSWRPSSLDPEVERDLPSLTSKTWVQYGVLAAILAGTSIVLTSSALEVGARTGLSESIVGAVLTAVTTSLPELVTTIAAVRSGAIGLAIGGIIGGNSFDVLFIALADVAYRPGSIYAEATRSDLYLLGLPVLLTGVLLVGLLARQKRGVGWIGIESWLLLVIYVVGIAGAAMI